MQPEAVPAMTDSTVEAQHESCGCDADAEFKGKVVINTSRKNDKTVNTFSSSLFYE
jgi:hypothetical protein